MNNLTTSLLGCVGFNSGLSGQGVSVMVEPGFEDLGKEIVLNFSYETNNKGIITSYNDKFVFVRMYGADEPRGFKRKFLSWPQARFGVGRCVGIF